MNENAQLIINKIEELNRIQDPHWFNHTFFTWRWWIGILFTIGPWILWIVIRDKNSTSRLLFVGFFAIIFSSYFDCIGTEYVFWTYEYRVLPTIPAFIPWDFSLFPVSIMLLLQYKPSFNLYLKAILFGLFTAYAAEPLFMILKLYSPITWKHFYSFLIYIAVYLVCHFLSRRKSFNPLT